MSSTKSSKGDKTVIDHKDGRFVSRDSHGRDPNPRRDSGDRKGAFPANRSLEQGELPKRSTAPSKNIIKRAL